MANNEEYRIDINADASKVIRTVDAVNAKVNQLASNFDKIFTRTNTSGLNNNFTVTQKQMDQAYRSLQAATKMANNFKQTLRDASANFSFHGDFDSASGAATALKNLNKQMSQTQASWEKMNNKFRTTQSSAFKINIDDTGLKDYNNMLSQIQRTHQQINSRVREYSQYISQARRYANQGTSSGYLSYQQGASLDSALTQGKTRSSTLLNEAQHNYETYRQSFMQKGNNYRSMLNEGTADPKELTRARGEMEYAHKLMEEYRSMTVTVENLNSEMQNVVNVMKENGGNINVRPKPGTTLSMLKSRAPAIGLNAMLAGTAVVGGLYSRGNQIFNQINPDLAYMENQAGGFHGIAQGNNGFGFVNMAQQTGKQYGFGTVDSMNFYSTMMGMAGYGGIRNLNAGANQMMYASRAMGLTANDTQGLFGALGAQGGVNSASQIRYIQQAIVGGVKQSGMEGREKEQVQALQSIAQTTFQGRDITSTDIQQMLGTQQVFANTGARSMQGTSGAIAINAMSQDIQNGMNDPMTAYLMGFGSKYTGYQGMWQLREQMQKGATPQNIQTIMNGANQYASGDQYIMKGLLSDRFPQLKPDQINHLYSAYQSGDFSEQNIKKILSQNQKTGKGKSAKNVSTYDNSTSGSINNNTAALDQAFTAMKAIGQPLSNLNAVMAGLPAPLYALTAAMTAVGVQLAMTLIALKGSSFIQSWGNKSFNDTDFTNNKGGGGFFSKLGNKVSNSRLGQVVSNSKFGKAVSNSKIGRATSNIFGKLTNASTIAASAEKAGGTVGRFGRLAGGLNKSLGWFGLALGVGQGVNDIMTAKKGQKAKTVGSTIGNLAGGFGGFTAGSEIGASIGTLIAPGVGTAIGGLIGGIGGGMAGSGIGSWIGGKVGSGVGWLGGKIGQGAKWLGGGISQGWNALFGGGNQSDKRQTNKNIDQTTKNERQRKQNIQDQKTQNNVEANNLGFWQKLINQIKSMGGLLGTGTNSSSSSSSNVSGSIFKSLSKSTQSAINQGMKNAGVSGSDWQNGLSYIIQHESSGNANATNGNAKGLMQLKPSNVSGNPYDATNNVQSGIQYILKRYGSIDAAVKFWQKNHWYANGTTSSASSNVGLGDAGLPELVQTPDGQVGFSPSTPTLYSNFAAGSKVTPLSQIPIVGSGSSSGSVSGNFNVAVDVRINGNGQAQVNTSQLQSIGQQIGNAINPMHFFSKNMQRKQA